MGRDHSIECAHCKSFYGGFDLPDECGCEGEIAKVYAQIDREAEERIALWPPDARSYMERMNRAYEHVCKCLNEETTSAKSLADMLWQVMCTLSHYTGDPSEQAVHDRARALLGLHGFGGPPAEMVEAHREWEARR